jgi:hypothetical protein
MTPVRQRDFVCADSTATRHIGRGGKSYATPVSQSDGSEQRHSEQLLESDPMPQEWMSAAGRT